jgi:hypothetical protein
MGDEARGRSTSERADAELENGDAELESGPLAQRLRNLAWPVPEPGRAEESWERFQQRLAERGPDQGGADGDPAA